MQVRIRVRLGLDVGRTLARNRELASLAAVLLTPLAALAFALGVWRLASDLDFARAFVIKHGLFSHWQVWIAMAGALQTCASILNRYGRGGGEAVT